jgi:nicotinamidase-related amidase
MDYQEATCREEGSIGRNGLGAEVTRRRSLQSARTVLVEFRRRGWPVVHVRVAFDSHYHRLTSSSPRFNSLRTHKMLLETDPGSEICSEVAPLPGEVVIMKGCVNPFVGTNLREVLIRLMPSELVLGGVATNHVVESTARYAADIGHSVIVLEDICASFTAELHEFTIANIMPSYAVILSSEEYFRAEPGHN